MRLFYRGIPYDPNSIHPEVNDDNLRSGIGDRHRAVSRLPHEDAVPNSVICLKYRGVTYLKFR